MKRFLQNSKILSTVFILFCFFFVGNVLGQSTANYTFATATTGSLATDLNSNTVDMTTGATSLVAASADDTQSSLVNIGFDFWLMGNLYTQFSASDNGILSLGAQPGTATYNLPIGTTATIAPFANDLRVGTNGLVSSKLFGTAPNRCLVIQYSNVMIQYLATAATGTGTFQVRLYETTGTIEYVYGAMTTNAGVPSVYNVGFSVNTTVNNLVTVNTTAHTASTSATVTNNNYTASSTISSLNSASNGTRRLYRFSQTAPNAPTGLTFTNIGAQTTTLNWTDNASNEIGYVIYYSTDNVTFSFLRKLNAGSTSAIITGLAPGTLYYYKVHAIREGAFSSALTGSQATSGGVAFTTSGSFTVPCYVTSLKVEAWGGGGKGGARTSGSNIALAGGGGGAYSSSVLTAPFSSPYTVTVGTGSSTTSAGGDSWFGSTTTVLSKGGSSVAGNSNTRGVGGLASAGFGTTKFNGGTGAAGSAGVYGGGGGSSAGSTAAGNFTNATTTQNAGALAPLNGGNGGVGAVSGVAGINGIFPGGGGGGGFRAGNATTQSPGNGANGQVLVSWTCPSATIDYSGGPFCKSLNSKTVTITGTDARTTCSNTFSATPAGLSINTTTGTINPSASTVGSYIVSYQLPAAGGCSAVNATFTVDIIDTPTIAAISTPAALCSGDSLNPSVPTITANGSTVSSEGWQLETTVGGSAFATLTVPYAVNFADNGKKIRYIATNSCGTTNGATATVTVFSVFTSGAIASTGETVCYNGDPAEIGSTTAASGGDESITYKWQANGVDIASSDSATYNPPAGLTSTTTYTRYTKDATCNTTFTLSSGSWVVTVSNSNTWTGSVSTSWTDAANWSCGLVPVSVSDVTIASATFYPQISSSVSVNSLILNSGTTLKVNTLYDLTVADVIANNGTLTVENNASLIQINNVANTGSGSTVVKRNSSAIMRLDYTLWSSPVAGQGLYAFSPFTFDYRFYTYNTSSNSYSSVSGFNITGLNGLGLNGVDNNNVQFSTGHGYLIRMPNYHPATPTVWTGTFTGTPNNGYKTVTLSNIAPGFRYNLVGNPYPSPLNAIAFVDDANNASNITGTLYFLRKTNGSLNSSYCTWTPDGFVTNNGAAVFDPNDVIQTGQGFFVEATATGNSLVFNNTMRVSNQVNQFFRNSNSVERNRIWLNVTNTSGLFSQTMLGYITNATNDVDSSIDGKYLADGDVALTSLIGSIPYAIQGRALPFDDTDVVPLNFRVSNAGQYSIAIDHVDGLFANNGQTVYLRDNLSSVVHNLTAGAYTFASDAGTFDSRFEILYQMPLGVTSPVFNANQVIFYKNEVNDFVINSGNVVMATVKVFDIRGRLLLEKNEINNSETIISVGQANEVLLLQITSQDGLVVAKKVIR
jgi:hypothetical protein